MPGRLGRGGTTLAAQPSGDELLTHLCKHYSDKAIVNDLDSVLSCTDNESAREAVRLYAQLRRNAHGFSPKVDGHNNHAQIGAPSLALLDPNRAIATAKTCPGCEKRFVATRSDKKTCSARCRTRLRRGARVTHREQDSHTSTQRTRTTQRTTSPSRDAAPAARARRR